MVGADSWGIEMITAKTAWAISRYPNDDPQAVADFFGTTRQAVMDIRAGRRFSKATGITPTPTPTQLRGARMHLNYRRAA